MMLVNMNFWLDLSVVRKVNNAKYKGCVKNKLNEEMNSGDTHRVEAIIDSFKFKSL